MEALQRYAPLIESALLQLPLGPEPKGLYEPMRYLLQLGGKRIRPALALMACEAVGGKAEQALPQAMAVELFHNFSLMHDDIMDKAPLRRGQPTVHHRWNLNTAILSGDGMLIKAYQELAKCEPHLLPDLLAQFSQTALEVCEGQQMDMDFEQRTDVQPAEYQSMIAFKTAVLLGCSMYLGARVGGATDAAARSLYQFGLDLGMAFQLRDDYLDTFGNPAETGKQPGGDILAGKKTWIYLHAQQQLTPEEQIRWSAEYAQATEADVPRWVNYFRQAGSDAAVLAESERYHHLALAALNHAGLKTEQQQPFLHLANWLLDRNH
jgi:geranylgeranyl diphosphate synthase type II